MSYTTVTRLDELLWFVEGFNGARYWRSSEILSVAAIAVAAIFFCFVLRVVFRRPVKD